jgi:hypothetical protein
MDDEIGKSAENVEAVRVFLQPSIADFSESEEALHDAEDMFAAGARCRFAAICPLVGFRKVSAGLKPRIARD